MLTKLDGHLSLRRVVKKTKQAEAWAERASNREGVGAEDRKATSSAKKRKLEKEKEQGDGRYHRAIEKRHQCYLLKRENQRLKKKRPRRDVQRHTHEGSQGTPEQGERGWNGGKKAKVESGSNAWKKAEKTMKYVLAMEEERKKGKMGENAGNAQGKPVLRRIRRTTLKNA